MERLPITNPYKVHLIKMLHCFEEYVNLVEEDIVLILLCLNTEEKIIRFMEWVQPKIEGGQMNTTAPEIMRAAVWIDKGRTDLP